jgi:hypothetical protein
VHKVEIKSHMSTNDNDKLKTGELKILDIEESKD